MMRLLGLVLLGGCLAQPDDGPEATFDALWAEFDLLYGPTADRAVDWDALHDAWRPLVGPDTDDDALWEVLTGMLATLDDGHVQLAAPGRTHWYANAVYRERIGDDRFDRDVVAQHYLDVHTDSDDVLGGWLEGDIAYLHLPWIAGNLRYLDELLDAAPAAPALVVDLRHDEGGDFTWAFQAFTRLNADPRPVFRSRTRNGPDGAFDDWTTWELPASDTPFTGRVVLLTDRLTISAGERATMALQALPDAVTIGEPTNGSVSTMIWRELPNRWSVSLPTQEVEAADGARPEGVGLPVDVLIENDPARVAAGIDDALEEAIRWARGG